MGVAAAVRYRAAEQHAMSYEICAAGCAMLQCAYDDQVTAHRMVKLLSCEVVCALFVHQAAPFACSAVEPAIFGTGMRISCKLRASCWAVSVVEGHVMYYNVVTLGSAHCVYSIVRAAR
jgi:hypothetical protein